MCIAEVDTITDSMNQTKLTSKSLDIDWDNCDYISLDALKNVELSETSLKSMQYNVRGILSKSDDLKELVSVSLKGQLDIVILSETWLTSKNKHMVQFPGYNYNGVEHKSRKGGGVGFLVKENLKFRERPDIRVPCHILEHHFIELKCNKENVLIGSLYRPPNTNSKVFLRSYKQLLTQLAKQPLPYVLGMDHNLDLLKIDIHQNTSKFVELNLDKGLIPCVTRPTRITHQSATLIDNTFIDVRLHQDSHTNIITIDLSDHLPSMTTIPNIFVTKKTKTSIEVRKFSDHKIAKIEADLNKINWDIELSMTCSNPTHEASSTSSRMKCNNSLCEDCVNCNNRVICNSVTSNNPHQKASLIGNNENESTVLFDRFHRILTETIDKHAPKKIVYKKPTQKINPWLTRGYKVSSQRLRQLYVKTLSIDSTSTLLMKYKQQRNLLNRLKRKCKIMYYQSKCVEFRRNAKKLWQIINEASGRINDKGSVIHSLKIDNVKTYSSRKISEEFGKYFATVGKTFANKIKDPVNNVTEYLKKMNCFNKSLFLSPTDPTEIRNLIRNLPNKYSSGNDDLNNIVLKKLESSIVYPLSLVFNCSLSSGTFPKVMKEADVIPLFKSKDPTESTNYRPISLLLTLSKLLEKVVYCRTYEFLNKNDQIFVSQYGFRSRHSCEDAINELLSNVVKANSKKQFTMAVFLDLSKAFDMLSHDLLLKKMELYGIHGQSLAWFWDYLNNRTLRAKCIDNVSNLPVYSRNYTVEYGAPQGSCLGPLMFLIFVNDLQLNLIFSGTILFADDTTIYSSHKNLDYLKWSIEQDLTCIADWFRANKLTLNLTKSECLIFGPNTNKNLPNCLLLDNLKIPVVKKTKFLGIWLDDKLNWKIHLANLKMKLKKNYRLLSNSKNMLTPAAQRSLYYAQIHSHIQYGLVTWGNMIPNSELNLLQKIQNDCVQTLNYKTDVNKLYKEHKILKIADLVYLANCKLSFKMLNNLLPKRLLAAFVTDANSISLIKSHDYDTRLKQLPNLPRSNHTSYSNSFLVKSMKDFQTLPVVTRNCLNLSIFTRACKKLILLDK